MLSGFMQKGSSFETASSLISHRLMAPGSFVKPREIERWHMIGGSTRGVKDQHPVVGTLR